ncbi:hypothetical protein [Geminocystis sp. NIES-3709]|uniref:hypothetical protein n=1 Tax=Geminocystis sp. NIES-3709 TaxID=1617448 RepID=UPI0005FC67C5|nr:hypothetical protein [Geminocystis sp. NIES-3709]BAQ65531.1 hypothetical protein GM3709_2296 [Geminocystis sp. NIES-3709]
MDTKKEELMIDVVSCAVLAMNKYFNREFNFEDEADKFLFVSSLSTLFLAVATDDEVRNKVQNIINEMNE